MKKNIPIEDLIDSFDSDEKNKGRRYREFLYHCFLKFEKQIKKMDNPDYAKKLANYEKNMDPKKRQALKDKATKGMKFTQEGMSYGLYKGSGKAGGAMKDYLDRKAKMLKKKRDKQSDAAKNNPHFDSTQPSPSGRNKYEQVTFQQFQEKCWAGYEKKGMKTMFGKRYPNCVKKKK